uniref:Cytoplasmic dynein 1 intermediate chain 1 n=1 Tax=Sphaerodactylus townsendi TaxID=933632 RepID=A0ACB8FUT6_9SAUR
MWRPEKYLPLLQAGCNNSKASPRGKPNPPFTLDRELTEEEKQQILHSEEFLMFFDRTIRVIERALAEDSDIFFDYSGRDVEEKDGDVQGGANLSFNRQFYDEHWSKHRVVTCMDWSLQYPELMVASYNNNEDAPHEPDGVALVWNMKFKKTTPEYVFHCQIRDRSNGKSVAQSLTI